jgi:nitroimidazol reductase NimA-like FMN-containing flavoprotein (pyridoxamine 5'-phosphate oxidase superfamily)
VCFEFDIDIETLKAEDACHWGMKYRSVVGFGKAMFIDDIESKRRALDIIMKQYSEGSYSYPMEALENMAVIKVEIENVRGKQCGY